MRVIGIPSIKIPEFRYNSLQIKNSQRHQLNRESQMTKKLTLFALLLFSLFAFGTANAQKSQGQGTVNAAIGNNSISLIADEDGDGVDDFSDNCVQVANADQRDTNGDGFGNICDADLNNDCIINVLDLALMESVFYTDDQDADAQGDGFINARDLGRMRLRFFSPPGPSGLPNQCGGQEDV